MFRLWNIMACALFVSMSAGAEPYSYEIEAGYLNADGQFDQSESLSLQGTYYFDAVESNDAPVHEAAFVRRSSSLTFGYAKTETESTPAFTTIGLTPSPMFPLPPILPPDQPLGEPAFFLLESPPDSDSDDYLGALRYVHDSGWLAEVAISALNSDIDQLRTDFDTDSNHYSVAVGKYVAPATTVTLGYRREQTDSDITTTLVDFCLLPPCPPPATVRTQIDDSEDIWSVQARHLLTSGARHHVFSGSLGYAVRMHDSRASADGVTPGTLSPEVSDKFHSLESSLGYTFYPLTNVGVGLSLHRVNAEEGATNSKSVFAEWFITNSIAVSARYFDDELDRSLGNVEGWAFGVTGRF